MADVIKLAGRGGAFDLESEFGVPAEHLAALDRVTRLAIAAGIDALRDAGIPLVMRYKTTTKGTQLPERWGLPDAMRDDTGVIFGSAFPGYDSFAEIMSGYYTDHARREELAMLEGWRARAAGNGHSVLGQEMDRRIDELRATIEKEPYVFDRRFLLRVLSMGHSQFAELIGARGPNTQINAACATTAQGVALARGLDPRRALPPRHHHLGRRRHLRQHDRMVRRRLSGQWSGSHRRGGRRRRHSLRPPPSRPDYGHGRRGPGGRERRSRAGTRNPAYLRSVERGNRQQRVSTALASMSSISAR